MEFNFKKNNQTAKKKEFDKSKPFEKRGRKPFGTPRNDEKRSERPFQGRKKAFSSKENEENSTFGYGREKSRPFGNDKKGYASKEKRGFVKKERGNTFGGNTFDKEEFTTFRKKTENKSAFDSKRLNTQRKPFAKKSFSEDAEVPYYARQPKDFEMERDFAPHRKSFSKKKKEVEGSESKGIRLNKYIANAGICSRREADVFIKSGNVKVNGAVISQMGYLVQPTDKVQFDGKEISSEKKVYVLLNKPKGFITTLDDEKGRKTVMELVANATSANIKPVGRLDRATTGLLLFTNDGDLAAQLTHPSYGVRKIYHAVLDKKLKLADFHKIQDGLILEDGFIQVDEISYVENAPQNEIGIRIHSGRNRIVRRIFEALGYEVEKLDRVSFAGLTKKDLPRGHWRFLKEQEVINLKNLNRNK